MRRSHFVGGGIVGLCALFLLLLCPVVHADDVFTGTGDWSSDTNWSFGFPPGSSDTADIEGIATQDITGGVTVDDLNLLATYGLTLDGNATVTNLFTMTGGYLDLGGQTLNAGNIDITGAGAEWETAGGTASSGTIDTGTLSISVGAGLTMDGTYQLNGNASSGGALSQTGTLNQAGTYANLGATALTSFGGTVTISGQVLNGGFGGNTGTPLQATMDVTGTANFNGGLLNNTGGLFSESTGSLTVTGNTVNDGIQPLVGVPQPGILRTEMDLNTGSSLQNVTNENGGLMQIGTPLGSFGEIVLPSEGSIPPLIPLNPPVSVSPSLATLYTEPTIPGPSTPPSAPATTISGGLLNSNGALFTYNGSGTFTVDSGITNTGIQSLAYNWYQNYSGPYEGITIPSGMVINAPLVSPDNITNENSAEMFLYGPSTVGLIDRPGGLPDEVASVFNESAGLLVYNPYNSSNLFFITGQATNTGAGTEMYLLGTTQIVGRSTSSPLFTNTAGATLNYDALVNVGLDRGLNVPAGNLNNTGGTIDGFGGNIIFRGGDQTNAGIINLLNNAQFTVGPTGENTLTNTGTLSAIGSASPATLNGLSYNTTIGVLNGQLTNTGTVTAGEAAINSNAVAPVATLDVNTTSAVNNNSTGMMTIFPDGEILLPQSLNNYGKVQDNGLLVTPQSGTNQAGMVDNLGTFLTTNAGASVITGGFLNNPGAILTVGSLTGPSASLGIQDNSYFLNISGGIVNVGAAGGAASTLSLIGGALDLNTGTVNVTGSLAAASVFNSGTSIYTNSGVTNLNGGTLSGLQVQNSGTINVLGGSTIAGTSTPINTGTIAIGAAPATLSITAGAGAAFTNGGTVSLAGGTLTGFGNMINNDDLLGSGLVSFPLGFTNPAGIVQVSGGSMTINNFAANGNEIDVFGGGALADSLFVNTAAAAFTNDGDINLVGNDGNLFNGAASPGLAFTNSTLGSITSSGSFNDIDFPGGITNNGSIQFTGPLGGFPYSLGLDNLGGALVTNNGSILGSSGGALAAGPVNNSGSIKLDPSSGVIGNLTNSGGVSVLSGSNLQTNAISNSGTISVSGSTLSTNANNVTNTGTITASSTSSVTTANVANNNGLVSLASSTGTFDAYGNNGANATTSLTSGTSATVDSLTNTGTFDIEGGSTLTSTAGPDTNAGGTLDITGAGSALSVNALDNTGGTIDVGAGGKATINGVLTNLNGAGTAVIDVDGASTLSTARNVLNTNGSITVSDGSLLKTGVVNQSGGSVDIESGGVADTLNYNLTGGTLTLNGPSAMAGPVATEAFTFFPAIFTNAGAVSMINGATASVFSFANTGSLDMTGSTFTSRTGADTNNGGTIDAGGSTITLNALGNAGGSITLAASSFTNVGAFTNTNVGGDTGILDADDVSTVVTGAVTNAGEIDLSGGSSLTTNQGGGGLQMLTTSGSVLASGASLLKTGFVTQNAGSVDIEGGSVADTFSYTLNGGTLTLNGPSMVAGENFTFFPAIFTNAGAVSMINGATASVFSFANTGSLDMTGSTFTSRTGADSNTNGTIDAGNSTITLNTLANTGGTIALAATSFTLKGTLTNSNAGVSTGILDADDASTLLTQTINNAGKISLSGTTTLKTSQSGLFDNLNNTGQVSVTGGSLLSTQDTINTDGQLSLDASTGDFANFSNLGASASTSLTTASTVKVFTLTNSGTVDIEGGSTFTSTIGPDNNSAGTIDVAGAGGALNVNALTNTGGSLTVENSATATIAGDLTNDNANGATGTVYADNNSMLTTQTITSAGLIDLAGGSILKTNQGGLFDNLTNTGEVTLAGGSLLSTQDLINNNGQMTLDTSTGDFANFSNNGANASTSLTAGSVINAFTLTNTGTLDIEGSSTFTSSKGPDSNANGTIDVAGGGSMLNVNALNNTAGGLTLENGGAAVIAGMLTNNNMGNSTGTVDADGNSTVTTQTITSAGSITFSGSSTLATNQNGIFAPVATSGSVVASGASFLNLGSVTESAGSVDIETGSAADVGFYMLSNNTASLTLNGPSTVVGQANTLRTSSALTNAGGTVALLSGATASVFNLNNNSGELSLTGASTFTSRFGPDTNIAGVITVYASTLNLNALNNNSGKLNDVAASTVNIAGGLMNGLDATGTVVVDGTSAMLTQDVTNAGTIDVEDASSFATNQSGVYEDLTNTGMIGLSGDSTLFTADVTNTNGQITLDNSVGDWDDFSNEQANATTTLTNESTVTVDSLTNTGTLSIEGGSTFTSNTGPDTNAGGTIDIAGSGSKLDVNALNNTGGVLTLENNAAATLDGDLTNNNNGNAIGTVDLQGTSTLTTEEVNSAGQITVSGGSTLQTDQSGLFDDLNNTGQVTVSGASSLLTQDVNNSNGQIGLDSSNGDFAVLKNTGADALLSLTDSSTVSATSLANTGTVDIEDGSTYTSRVGPDTNLEGTIDVAGVGSALNLKALDNTGGILTLESNADGTIAGDLTNNNNGTAIGTVEVQNNSTLTTQQIDSEGSITISGASTLETDDGILFDDLNNTGQITVSGASSLLTQDVDNNDGQISLNNSNGDFAVLNNTGPNASLSLTDSSTVSATSLANTGAVQLSDGSTFTSRVGPDTNLLGTIDAAGSTLNLNALDNTGGILTLESTADATIAGDLTNNNNGTAIGTVEVQNSSTLLTRQIDSEGSITVSGESTLSTDQAAPGVAFDDLNTTGSVVVSGGSLLDVGDVNQNGGSVDVETGAGATVDDYTLTGLNTTLTLNGATIVPGKLFTLFATGAMTNGGLVALADGANASVDSYTSTGGLDMTGSDFTSRVGPDSNAGGAIDAATSDIDLNTLDNTGGAIDLTQSTLTIAGDLTNNNAGTANGVLIADDQSDVLVRQIDSEGSITISGESALATNQGGGFQALNTTGSVVAKDASFLDLGDVNQTGGSVDIEGGSAIVTDDYTMTGNTTTLTLTGASDVPGKANTLASDDFSNTSGTVSLADGATANVDSLSNTNGGTISISGGSTFTSVFGPDSNEEGTIAAENSTLSLNALNNTGGTLSLFNTMATVAGDLNSSNGPGSTASISLDGASTLATRLITNQGSITLTDESTLATNQGGGGFQDLNTTGSVVINDGSLLDIGDMNQTGGSVDIEGGSAAVTDDYTMTGNTTTLTLTGASTVAGKANTLVSDDFSNTGGTVSLADGATAVVDSLSNTSGGTISISGGSTFSSDLGPDSNADGTIAVTGSRLLLNALDNTGGVLDLGGSTATIAGMLTNNNGGFGGAGTIDLDAISDLTTQAISNEGSITLTDESLLATDENGAYQALTTSGSIVVDAGSGLDVGTVTETGGSVTIQGGSVGDTGNYSLAGGSSLTLNGAPTVAGALATLFTSGFTNAGTVTLLNRSSLDVLSLTNTGAIFIDPDSFLQAEEASSNSGTIVANAADLATGNPGGPFADFNNTGGTLSITDTGTANFGELTNGAGGDVELSGSESALNVTGLDNGGSITADDESIVDSTGSDDLNSGTLSALGGSTMSYEELTNSGILNVVGAGDFATPQTEVMIADDLNTSGDVTVSEAGQLTVNGDVNVNGGFFQILDGTATIGGALNGNGGTIVVGRYGVIDPPQINVSNTFIIQPGGLAQGSIYTQTGASSYATIDGTLQVPTGTINSGTMTGSGTVEGSLTNSGGILIPGDITAPNTIDAPILTITDQFGTGADSDLLIYIDSLINYSQLDVGGDITLDGGVLSLDLDPSYHPEIGDRFQVILGLGSGDVDGDFDSLDPNMSYSNGYFVIEYEPSDNPSGVDVVFVPEPTVLAPVLLAAAGLLTRRPRRKLAA